jgi:hypothetical protein
MWLYTTIGFFSVVQKSLDGQPDDGSLLIRARANGDLEALREKYMPELGEIIYTPHGDYKFRASISHDDFARGLAGLVKDVDYSNFKSEVARKQGNARAYVYHNVWAASIHLERLAHHD